MITPNNNGLNQLRVATVEAALELAAANRPIFPVGRDKKPRLDDWPHKAGTDLVQIRAWFDKAFPPNIALVTGAPSGVFVLDVDAPEGLASLAELESRHGALGRECAAQTPSGGLHLYFKMPDDFDLRNSAGKIGGHLDIRANGGYVLVPPGQAVNREGRLGHYAWLSEITLTRGEIPAAPGWLLDLLRKPKNDNGRLEFTRNTHQHAYGAKALEEECRQVAAAPQGRRNDTLNRAAFALFQLVAGGELEPPEVERRLTEAALAAGLPSSEIEATLKSAAKQGLENPRHAPQNLPVPVARPAQSVQPETESAADAHLPPL